MCNILKISTIKFMTIVIFVVNKETCFANFLPKIPSIESNEIWLPRELGRFHLKDAAFVEVYETTPSLKTIDNQNSTVYADQYNLYITTFNAGILIIFTVTVNLSECTPLIIQLKLLFIIIIILDLV